VLLAAAMAYAVHTMMSLSGSSSPSSKPQPAAVGTTGSPAAPAPAATATPALPVAPTLGGAVPTDTTTTSAASTGSTQLVDAVRAPAGVGQLQSFSLFESKDPFNASGPGSTATVTKPSSGGSSSSSGGGGSTSSKPPKTPPATAPASVTSSPSSTQVMPSAITTSQCQRLQGSRSSRAGISLSITPKFAFAFAFTPVKMGRSRSGMYYCNSILLTDMVLPFNVPVTFTLMSFSFFRSAINCLAFSLLAASNLMTFLSSVSRP